MGLLSAMYKKSLYLPRTTSANFSLPSRKLSVDPVHPETEVQCLYNRRTLNKIVHTSEIRQNDVAVATTSFDYYPFEDLRTELTPKEIGQYAYSGASHTVSFKISILGRPGIGKSAIALRFSKSDFLSYYEATIEEEFEKRVTVQGVDVDLSILDTAGQEAFQALRSNWIAGRDGFILGFDATKPTTTAINELFE